MVAHRFLISLCFAAAAADSCPWQSHGCRNSDGVCNSNCAKSNFYDTDSKCVCGPSGDDWITQGQCQACTLDETVSVTDSCPWQSHGCRNSEGACNANCAKSQWYDSDYKCVCGSSGDDWITQGQCNTCSLDVLV